MERHKATRAAIRRMLSPTMRYVLHRRGLMDDMQQEIALVAWQYKNDDDIAYMRAIQRALYRWLKNEGFFRDGKSYNDPVIPFTTAMHANTITERDRQYLILQGGFKYYESV